jgi:hypothetical protein
MGLQVGNSAAQQWLVRSTDGAEVGPVSLELIARGLCMGKVPADAQVSLAGSLLWEPAVELFGPIASLAKPRRNLPTPQYLLPLAPPAPVSNPIPSAPGSLPFFDDAIELPKHTVLNWFS